VVATGFAARDFFAAVLGAALTGAAWLSLGVERFDAGFVFWQMKVGIKMRRQEGDRRDVPLSCLIVPQRRKLNFPEDLYGIA